METILCFGDSITHGRGEMPNIGWAGRLKNFFESKDPYKALYNLGIPGETSTELLIRFETELKSRLRKEHERKYLILIAIGANDAKYDIVNEAKIPRTDLETYEKNIRQIVNITKKYKNDFAFIELIPADETRTKPYEDTVFENNRLIELNNILKKVTKENNIRLIELFDDMQKQNISSLLEDGIHPNAKGYDFMFEKIKNFLEENGLI